MRNGFGCFAAVLLSIYGAAAKGQQGGPKPEAQPFAALHFLEGTWQAKATRPDGVAVSGQYTFEPELNGTVLARHSSDKQVCKGPESFDCQHKDLLYVFADAPGMPLKAIFFDSEGHVIHYAVTLTSPTSVEFLSDPGAGPQFRLAYELKSGVMSGRFQMRMAGGSDWRSYLEWSGERAAR